MKEHREAAPFGLCQESKRDWQRAAANGLRFARLLLLGAERSTLAVALAHAEALRFKPG